MPPVSHPFKNGALVVLMNYSDHAPPHVHIKYQRDVRSYRLTIQEREWLKPGRDLPPALRRLVESWVEAHELELLDQWHKAQSGEQVEIVG